MRQQQTTTKKTRGAGNRVIAFLTDFGHKDHYVGTVKGVILGLNPRATVVDLAHDVTAHNIREAGYLLWASYRYFPGNTIFLAVVDPGVGGSRRIICAESGSNLFLAPDNGLLDFVIFQERIRTIYEIRDSLKLVSRPVSSTFHGRDIFGPLAANLSLGKPLSRFGTKVRVTNPPSPFYESGSGQTEARILHVDRFGNIITNIPGEYVERSTVTVGSSNVSTRVRTFSEAPENEACMIVGSSGLIEIVVKESNAASILGAHLSTPLRVLKKA